MEGRRWLNGMHPRLLLVAELLCYLGGLVLTVRGLTGLGAMTTVSGIGLCLAGVALSSEVALGWYLAVAAAGFGIWSAGDHLVRQPDVVLASPRAIDLTVALVVLVLVLHPETRQHRARYFR